MIIDEIKINTLVNNLSNTIIKTFDNIDKVLNENVLIK
jgi:hypothetical protein